MTLALTPPEQRRLVSTLRVLASSVGGDSEQAWRRQATARARAAVGADTAVLVLPQSAGFEVATSTRAEGLLPEYEPFFPLLVETGTVQRGARVGVGTRRELYGPHVAEMMRSVYVREFLTSIRSFDAVSIIVPVAPRVRGMEDAAQLTLSVSRPDQTVTPRQAAIARLLHPAFAVGLQAHATLRRARAQLRSAVDATGVACLVADRDGRVRHRSPALEALLLREPERERLVEQAVRMAGRYWTGAPEVRSTVACSGGSYRLSATEIADGPEVFCVVLVTRPSPRTPAIPARYGLTKRQAEVALLLAERRSNKEIASALAISVHTARHHVEAVLGALQVPRSEVGRALADSRSTS